MLARAARAGGSGLERSLAAEFIGTFALIFFGAGSIIVTSGLVGTPTVAVAFAHGLTIAIMVSVFGHISGGLFNPAVTVGFWVTRRLNTPAAIAYIAAQLLGALAGALVLLVFPDALRQATDGGTPVLGSGIGFMQGAVIEAVLTFFLVLAIFGTALDPRGPKLGGFAIGLAITVDILAAGRLTGASMNPARTFGPAVVNNVWDDHLVYWIGPIIGAVLAALLYHYLFMAQDEPQTAERAA